MKLSAIEQPTELEKMLSGYINNIYKYHNDYVMIKDINKSRYGNYHIIYFFLQRPNYIQRLRPCSSQLRFLGQLQVISEKEEKLAKTKYL